MRAPDHHSLMIHCFALPQASETTCAIPIYQSAMVATLRKVKTNCNRTFFVKNTYARVFEGKTSTKRRACQVIRSQQILVRAKAQLSFQKRVHTCTLRDSGQAHMSSMQKKLKIVAKLEWIPATHFTSYSNNMESLCCSIIIAPG